MQKHELNKMPDLSSYDFSALKESIKKNGYLSEFGKIVIYEGGILDGWHRYKACKDAGVEPEITDFTGDRESAINFVISAISRRHLSDYAKYEALDYMREELAEVGRKKMSDKGKEGRSVQLGGLPTIGKPHDTIDTRKKIADELGGWSNGKISQADYVKKHADETTKEKLRAGEETINSAYVGVKKQQKKKEVLEAIKEQQENPMPNSSGKYRVIYADPPWKYNTEQHCGKEQETTIGTHYPSMSTPDICKLPIGDISEDNAVCFLWATSPLLLHGLDVLKSWGFTYKASMVWDKVKHNVGHYVSVRHEILLIGTRGSCTPDIKKLHDSVHTEERTEHSKKPEHFRKVIDEIYPIGSRVELFARRPAEGWDVWGNQL